MSEVALFLLTAIIVALSLGLVFTVQHNKKYGCVQGVCKQSSHGDFTSMAACKNNCRPPVVPTKCRPNSNLSGHVSDLANDICMNFSTENCPTKPRVLLHGHPLCTNGNLGPGGKPLT